MKPSTRVVEDITTLFEISGASTPERTSVALKTDTSSEGLGTAVTQYSNETTQPHEVTPIASTGSQFNNQQTTASKNVYITQSTQATEQPQFSTGVNDLSTSTEETSTSQSHLTTESNMITTHELTSYKVLITETKVHSEQASTSRKFQSQGITTTMEPTSTITGTRTTKHTTYPLSTTKDYPTTEAENTTSKPTSSERNVTTKTTHSSKLYPVTTDSLSVRRKPASTFMYTTKQETSTKEIKSTEISSTTGQDIKTTELPFSTMTTPAMSGNFTTARPTTPPFCPTNMVYMNCDCQSTCEYPSSMNSCYINCTEGDACICPDGFYLMEGNCVPPEECSCYYADGGVIIQVFQRREDGSVDFFLYWADYKEGFGDPRHETWLGLEKLFYLTNQRTYKLKISLISDNTSHEITHSSFRISNENDNYRLTELGFYTSTLGMYYEYLRHEMWFGLEKLHYLTYQGIYRLESSLVSDTIHYEMNYWRVAIDSEGTHYTLKEHGTYSKNIGLCYFLPVFF
ncbi:Tenascin-N [Holothuria leucospilota]|uniref:Tenascin-N n=1 Tax=Holothuria leucospilota TaxID=206669 RepID=A0A9Q1H545_HOLLE|nr:Tenascin-N [Holothuria leucospilota]